jgi:hypothetical protein
LLVGVDAALRRRFSLRINDIWLCAVLIGSY